MSVQPRPADPITEDFLLQGLPVVDFAFEFTGGGFGADFGLGILASAEVQKELQFSQLRNSASGTSKLVREFVRQFDGTLQVTTFRHSGQNMQLIFASSLLSAIAAGTIVVAADPINLTADPDDFLTLANQLLLTSPTTTFAAAEIALEAVGTGQGGTFGETTGDFALDFKPLVIADITVLTVGGVDRLSDVVAGSLPTGTQIAFVEGAVLTGGEITFAPGDAPAVGEAIVCTYEPSFALAYLTDFVVDHKSGRIRLIDTIDGATDAFRSFQPMTAGYSYSQPNAERINPFSQFTFPGRATIRQLTDVGANLVWTVPKAQIRLTGDAFTFNRDDLTQSTLALQFLEDDANPSAPFGVMDIFREGTF